MVLDHDENLQRPGGMLMLIGGNFDLGPEPPKTPEPLPLLVFSGLYAGTATEGRLHSQFIVSRRTSITILNEFTSVIILVPAL